MARPKVPLISRRKALEAALGIIDNEGLKALSIRRLGEVMNVNGASLYHHFTGKDEILVGVTQLALADVTAPRSETDSWRVWLPLNAYRTRQALIAHPELISVMLRRVPLGIGSAEVEASVARLRAEGVEMSVIAPLMESFELLAISSALQAVGGANTAQDPAEVAPAEDSMYEQAQKARGLSNDELFEVVCAAVIASVESAVHLKEARASSLKEAQGSPRKEAAGSGRKETEGSSRRRKAVPGSTRKSTRASSPEARASSPEALAASDHAPSAVPVSPAKRTARSARGATARKPAAASGRRDAPSRSGPAD